MREQATSLFTFCFWWGKHRITQMSYIRTTENYEVLLVIPTGNIKKQLVRNRLYHLVYNKPMCGMTIR